MVVAAFLVAIYSQRKLKERTPLPVLLAVYYLLRQSLVYLIDYSDTAQQLVRLDVLLPVLAKLVRSRPVAWLVAVLLRAVAQFIAPLVQKEEEEKEG